MSEAGALCSPNDAQVNPLDTHQNDNGTLAHLPWL